MDTRFSHVLAERILVAALGAALTEHGPLVTIRHQFPHSVALHEMTNPVVIPREHLPREVVGVGPEHVWGA